MKYTIGGPKMSGNFVHCKRELQHIVYIYNMYYEYTTEILKCCLRKKKQLHFKLAIRIFLFYRKFDDKILSFIVLDNGFCGGNRNVCNYFLLIWKNS